MKFNQDLSDWDTSNVLSMRGTFGNNWEFNRDLSSWSVSNVKDMKDMFSFAWSFNQNLESWDTGSVTDMSYMFYYCNDFNQPLGTWDVSSVLKMDGLFGRAYEFHQDLKNWNPERVVSMDYMFYYNLKFNTEINNWNVANVKSMEAMFKFSEIFNQPLNQWDVSSVTNMKFLFQGARQLNQPMDKWDVSAVKSFRSTFVMATFFNQPLSNWDTSNADDMEFMFFAALRFNQNLAMWETGEVTNMRQMFRLAGAFNDDISSWDVSSVTNFDGMFAQTKKFGQDICFDRVLETTTISVSSFLDKNELGSYCTEKYIPDANSPCGDCRTSVPFQLFGGKQLNCDWLANQDNREELCTTHEVVKEACPDTCASKCDKQTDFRCVNIPIVTYCGDCEFSPFILFNKMLNCKWLSQRENRVGLCAEHQQISNACPETCQGKCRRKNFSCDKPPMTNTPTIAIVNECNDCALSDFTIFVDKNLNCRWLSRADNRADVCANEAIVQERCPDTCGGKCTKFVCIDPNATPAPTVLTIPTPSPTIPSAPTRTSCFDCPDDEFKLWKSDKLNCKWLTNFANRKKVCEEQQNVRDACPDTCKGNCAGGSFECVKTPTIISPTLPPAPSSCGDCATEAPFTMWEGKKFDCKWLLNFDNREKVCNEQSVAKNACPETCNGECSAGNFNCVNVLKPTATPTLGSAAPTIAPCGDCETENTFNMWEGRQFNCRWLHGWKNRQKVCDDQEAASAACPETCEGKCSGGFTCVNPQGKTDGGENNPTVMNPIQTTATPTLTPVATPLVTPTIAPCGDCETENTFNMWEGRQFNCRWLHGWKNRQKVCDDQEAASAACPETCEGKCSGGFTCANNPKNRQRNLSGTTEKKVIYAPCTETTKFILDGRKRTCKWLATVGSGKISEYCNSFKVVKDGCPETCKGYCGSTPTSELQKYQTIPSAPTRTSCFDCPNNKFVLWKSNLTCKWLINFANRNKICEEQQSVRDACPDTCKGNCAGGSFECVKPPHPPSAESVRHILCDDDAKLEMIACKWLQEKTPIDRSDICSQRMEVRSSCPNTCHGLCGASI